MTAIKPHLDWLFLILSFLITIHFTDSRYLKIEETDNDLTSKHVREANVGDDDVDLETFLEDYYDDLWQYLEMSVQEPEKGKKEEGDGEKMKPNIADYDYLSDMAVAEPEVDDKKFKNLGRSSSGAEKKNLTWSPNGYGFNGSLGDNGIPDAVRAYRESNSQEEFPLRSKEMRLKSIIDQVLSLRGGSPRSNETIPDAKQYNALREIYEKNIKRIKSEEGTPSYTEKVQSFYPSCDVPRNTEEDAWFDPHSMNLLFDLDYPAPLEDSTILIVSAKLRLYKLPMENYSLPYADGNSGKFKSERTQNGFGILPGDDDRQIRVSVYWYTRSLRRNRVKKKLLDSQMLSVYAPKWAEFNIRPAVRTWKESGRNFGLVVNVEDEDGLLLPADQYIHAMNCSKWTATVRPIPSIVMDRVNQYFIENLSESKNETVEGPRNDENRHKIYPYQPLLYPIIDLCTKEVPNSDVKNIALNLSRKGLNVVNDSFSIFLKKNNLDMKEISKLSRANKSFSRKSETKNEGPRTSNFHNVPIGSPSTNQNEGAPPKKSREALEEPEVRSAETETGGEKREEMPRIRHKRKQWDMFQKPTNTNSRLRNDFNATDHH